MEDKKLVELARAAQLLAYAPYSRFQVGAALLGKSGKVYTGCNVENASFGATNCAERTAVFKAVSEGEREFEAIAVTSSAERFTYPCGICRQVLSEFSSDIKIILWDKDEGIRIYKASELFPHSIIPLDEENI
ncbi:MAG: cytidine deaminase [Eubacteriales bacterium]